MNLVPDQPVAIVAVHKAAREDMVLVLPNAASRVAGHSRMDRVVLAIGHDVNEITLARRRQNGFGSLKFQHNRCHSGAGRNPSSDGRVRRKRGKNSG